MKMRVTVRPVEFFNFVSLGRRGGRLRFLAAFISAKEGRTRHSYFQVVGIRLVGRCDVLINQQADVFQGIQPFALQQVPFFMLIKVIWKVL